MNPSIKVLTNTVVLYAKIIISTLVNLYLTRVVLAELGIEDFGIYNLVGSVIAILAFVETALMSSSQRYLSFSLGKGVKSETRDFFSASLLIHIIVGVVVVFVLELCGLFLFDGALNIPEDRLAVARIVYQIMIVSTLVTIIGIPYNSAINAYEDIWYYGIAQTVCVCLKLGVIWCFSHLVIDSLLIYSLWMLIVTFIGVLASIVWCLSKYDVCKHINLSIKKQMSRIREMAGFTGWNTLGAFAVVTRNQGVSIVLNVFFGTAINGVYGIANQVDGQLISFSNTLTSSLSPQIVKSQGMGDKERLRRLAIFASKLAFLLSAILALPLLLELPLVLNVWLKEVPEYTEIYCRLVLIVFLVCELYPGLSRGIQAVGIIKWQQIWSSIFVVSPIFLGIVLFMLGLPHYFIVYAMLLAQIASLIVVLYWGQRLYELNVKKFCIYILKAFVLFALLYYGLKWLDGLLNTITGDFVRFVIISLMSVMLYGVLYYYIAFDMKERSMLANMINKIMNKK